MKKILFCLLASIIGTNIHTAQRQQQVAVLSLFVNQARQNGVIIATYPDENNSWTVEANDRGKKLLENTNFANATANLQQHSDSTIVPINVKYPKSLTDHNSISTFEQSFITRTGHFFVINPTHNNRLVTFYHGAANRTFIGECRPHALAQAIQPSGIPRPLLTDQTKAAAEIAISDESDADNDE